MTRSLCTADEDADKIAAERGIRRLPVATPFSVGPVNVYLLGGDPPVLIDSGPNIATSLIELETQLAVLGYRLSDLGAVIVTHLHVDHIGLAGLIAERGGTDVVCLAGAAESAQDFATYSRRNDEYAATLMIRHGVDPAVVQALRSVSFLARAYGAPFRTTMPIADGDEIEVGGCRLAVHERPGHSPFDTVFLDEERRTLFSGDHLLSKISSNALITRPAGKDDPLDRPHPLLEYRESMLATRALDCDLTLGGHGPAITDTPALIDERLRAQNHRADQIAELLRAGPMSAHGIARTIWGAIAFTQAFLTISEVLGHLDLLVEAGQVVEHDGERVRYELI